MSFSVKLFRQALQQSSKLAQKLEKFIQDCRKHKVDVMYFFVEEIYKILSQKEAPILKVNALFASQLLLQICEYPVIQMAEAFLLPLWQEIALYHSDKRTYAKTSKYFRDKDYPGSIPNLEQLSHNYVTIATKLVFQGAAIKDTYYFYTDKLTMPSAFKVLASKLALKKVDVQSLGPDWKQKYEKNLQKFSSNQDYQSAYVNLFKTKLERYLVEGGKGRQTLDFKKLMKNGDSWLTSELLGCLNQSLEDDNFSVRRLAIGLLNEMFVSGDIEAIMVLNEGEAVQRICERVMEVKGSSDIGRGAQIYPQIAGQLETKKNFYIQFLRCIQLWAKLVPKAIYLNLQQESRIAKLYQKLQQKSFIFPSNDFLTRFSKDFQENMKKNEQRNNFMIQTLNEVQSQRGRSISSNRISKYSQKISLIKQMRQSTILSLPQMEKLIEETQHTINLLPSQQRQIMKHMKVLKYFSEEFQKKFELIQDSVTQSRLQNMYLKGLKCLQKIQEINSYYQELKNARLDFKQFADAVSKKCSQIDKSKLKAKASDILSKLSKSKEIMSLSRSKLELSHSLHTIKPKEQDNKPDYVLQKPVNGERDNANNQTKTIANLSNLELDSKSYTNKMKSHYSKYSKKQQIKSKQSSQVSASENKNSSIVSQSSQNNSQDNTAKEKNQTAKFIVHNDYQFNTNNINKPKQQLLKAQPSKDSNSGEFSKNQSKSSKKQASKNGSKTIHNCSNVPSGHFNQHKQLQKPKQQFSEGSNWSECSHQKQKVQAKEKSNFGQVFTKNVSKNQQINDKTAKSREVFSDSSFSHYDQENEQLRQAIDKSENPDFKMLFKDQKSKLPKMSKMSKIPQSQDHYKAVLQSLSHKSIEGHDQSRFSKDKQTSQLPHKSNFDTSSKLDHQRPNNAVTYTSKFRNQLILEDDYEIGQKRKKEIDRKSSRNSRIIQRKEKNSSLVSHSKSGSKLSDYKSSSNLHEKRSNEVAKSSQYENSMHPYYQNCMPIKVIDPRNSPRDLRRENSEGNSKSNKGSQFLQESKSSAQINVKSSVKHQSIPQYSKNQNLNAVRKQPIINLPTSSALQVVKTEKIKQIQQLQQKIRKLREQQRKLNFVRGQWQSPTRPQTLRTAISPRFRNNVSDYTHQFQSFKRIEEQTNEKRRQLFLKQNKGQQMNFDLVELFKPPQGKLIYKRLYKRQLAQLNIRQKRKILKNKDLVFRNQDVEVGLMIHKQPKELKIVYYVTSNIFLRTFLFRIQPSPKIAIHMIPASLSNLQPKKQYRIYLFAQIVQFPYKMPVIQFKYHTQLLSLQQNLFLDNQTNYFSSIVPFFFTKFLTIFAVTAQQMASQWSFPDAVRSQETLYSRKVLPKHFYALQYFPELLNIESKEYQSVYAMECQYGSTRFLVRIVLKINKFFYIQGLLTSYKDRQNSEKLMQFAICCLCCLFQRGQREQQQ